jgi:hypothetical protein
MSDDPFTLLDERRRKRESERMAINKRLSQMNAEGEQDDVARKVLLQMYPNGFSGATGVDTGNGLFAPAQPRFSLHDTNSKPDKTTTSASEMALEVVKDAYPDGLAQEQIAAKIFLRYRATVSENTVRVSMIRHRARIKARYTDSRWFYIPYDQRAEYERLLASNGAANGEAHQ